MKLSIKKARELGIVVPKEKPKSRTSPQKRKENGSNEMFLALCEAAGIGRPLTEVQFCPGRRWRFDYFFPGNIALEVEGGVWTQGRHTRGAGFLKDVEKYNEATILGYRVLRCTPKEINNGSAIELVIRAIEKR